MSSLPKPQPPPAPTHLLRTHTNPVSTVSISLDNERIYSGDSTGLVVVTSTRSLRAITRWAAHTDSLLGVEEWGERVITHARDNKLHVWKRVTELPVEARVGSGSAAQAQGDLPVPELCYSMDVNALNYCRFSLLPDGHAQGQKALVALPNLVDSTSADIWSLPSRERMHAAIGQSPTARPSLFNSDPADKSKTGIIMALHVFTAPAPSSSSRELRLLCAYESGSVALRRYARPNRPMSVEGAGWEVVWDVKVHAETVMAMCVSRSNTFALTVSADHLVGRYDLNDSNAATACTTHRTTHPGNGAVAIHDSGRVCALAGWDGSIRLHATKTMKPLGTLRYHKTGCQAVEFASASSHAHSNVAGATAAASRGRDGDSDGGRDAGEGSDESRGAVEDGGEDGDQGEFGEGEGDEEDDSESESDNDNDNDERADRARWLVGGGKDTRVSIWTLIDFTK